MFAILAGTPHSPASTLHPILGSLVQRGRWQGIAASPIYRGSYHCIHYLGVCEAHISRVFFDVVRGATADGLAIAKAVRREWMSIWRNRWNKTGLFWSTSLAPRGLGFYNATSQLTLWIRDVRHCDATQIRNDFTVQELAISQICCHNLSSR